MDSNVFGVTKCRLILSQAMMTIEPVLEAQSVSLGRKHDQHKNKSSVALGKPGSGASAQSVSLGRKHDQQSNKSSVVLGKPGSGASAQSVSLG